MKFDYSLDFKKTDFRKHPELYRVGVGEQGVLSVEPYKSEMLPHWRFKTPEIARQSSKKLYEMFLDYKQKGDFVGMDMARKFLQMGYTRSRRYANHSSGRKYKEGTGKKAVLPRSQDQGKAQSAAIFYKVYLKAKNDKGYQEAMRKHKAAHEQETKAADDAEKKA